MKENNKGTKEATTTLGSYDLKESGAEVSSLKLQKTRSTSDVESEEEIGITSVEEGTGKTEATATTTVVEGDEMREVGTVNSSTEKVVVDNNYEIDGESTAADEKIALLAQSEGDNTIDSEAEEVEEVVNEERL